MEARLVHHHYSGEPCKACQQEGIKEVVDSFRLAQAYSNPNTRRKQIEAVLKDWQAKLKEWQV